ncbi:lysophosphatidic acid receptor 6-like [Salminus brasiliensis]|uniref:lysophosphatidic acid receptor 6-like n=1 Tax=Salminus brasiliensis TaxID=930266 RepID=UPI003B8364C3
MDRLLNTSKVSCNHSDQYKYPTYTAVFSLVFVFGLVGNAGALYVFCKLSVKNRLSTIILIHLAASDLVFILTLPLRIAFYASHSLLTTAAPASSVSSNLMVWACRISTYLFYISMYCSILFLTALSVCRYLVLAGRVRIQNSEACRWARTLCWGIWCLVLGGNTLYILATYGFKIEAEGCLEPSSEVSWGYLYHLNLVVLVVCFALPLVVVLVCYSLMIQHILQTRAGQRRRDICLVCLVLCIFCLCFLPYHIQRTLHLYYMMHQERACQLQATLQKTVVVTLCFAAMNSCLDPFIFLFVGHGFIPVVKKIVAQCTLRGQSHGGLASTGSNTISPTAVWLPLVRSPNNVEVDQASPELLRFSKKGDTTA